MAGPTTEVLNTALAEWHQIGIRVAELQTEVRSAIALAKWCGTIFVASLLGGGVSAIWWGASLTTKVNGMETRGNEKFQEVSNRIDKLEAKLEGRFDRLDAAFIKGFDQIKSR
jgi:hypothetical protein